MNNKLIYQTYTGILCFLIIFSAMPQKIIAAELIQPNQNVTLTVNYQRQGKAVSGTTFLLYRVADVSPYVKFTLTDSFKSYPVTLTKLDSAGWRALASTLAGYAARDSVASFDSGVTDQNGLIKFPKQKASMTAGLYLVVGRSTTEGQYTYTPEPFLVCLPNRSTTNNWDYDVTAVPKSSSEYSPPGGSGGGSMIDRKALKVWKDSGNENQRPQEIVVQLLRNGRVYDTAKLNSGNNWKHTWTGLSSNQEWQMVEADAPKGYTVSVVREGATFVITNTYEPEPSKPPDNSNQPGKPDDPNEPGGPDDPNGPSGPNDPNGPGGPDDPNGPGGPDDPNGPGGPDDPNGPGGPNDPNGPGGPNDPNNPDNPNWSGDPNEPGESIPDVPTATGEAHLPKTGMLWWPIPAMAGVGTLVFLIGWARRRKYGESRNE